VVQKVEKSETCLHVHAYWKILSLLYVIGTRCERVVIGQGPFDWRYFASIFYDIACNSWAHITDIFRCLHDKFLKLFWLYITVAISGSGRPGHKIRAEVEFCGGRSIGDQRERIVGLSLRV